MKNRKCLLILLLVLFMPLMVDALDEYVSLDWKSKIGNDLYQDITKIGNEYVGRGFDFDRISKVNDLYFFFSGLKCLGFTI